MALSHPGVRKGENKAACFVFWLESGLTLDGLLGDILEGGD